MDLLLEDFVPYEQSSLWKIHDAYFASRGAAAWRTEIPSLATSSYAMAKQQARLAIALVGELEREGALRPDEAVRVLEVGCGSGKFARMFLRALERGTGNAGKALLPRMRYVLTDYSAANVKDALLDEELASREAQGLIVPALCDARSAGGPRGLDGSPVEGRFAIVFANYLLCVTPHLHLRKKNAELLARHVRIRLEAELAPRESVEEAAARHFRSLVENATEPSLMKKLDISFEWRPFVEEEARLLEPSDRRVLDELLGSLRTRRATVLYPRSFLVFTRSLRERLVPGGALVVNDYGRTDVRDLSENAGTTREHYGNTLNHGVDFPVLDAFARVEGVDIIRTSDALLAVHTAVLRFGGRISSGLRKSFRKTFVRDDEGQRLIEVEAAAREASYSGDARAEARLLARCLRHEPDSSELLFQLGRACIDAGYPREGLRALRRGQRLDKDGDRDFDFAIARAHAAARRFAAARDALLLSIGREDTAEKQVELSKINEGLGDDAAAYAALRRALELDREGPLAKTVIARLIEHYLPRTVLAARPCGTASADLTLPAPGGGP